MRRVTSFAVVAEQYPLMPSHAARAAAVRAARWSDEEIAIATLLEATAAWVRGAAPAPYPLADGAQDHLIALAVEEAADTDRTVTTGTEAWAVTEPTPAAGS